MTEKGCFGLFTNLSGGDVKNLFLGDLHVPDHPDTPCARHRLSRRVRDGQIHGEITKEKRAEAPTLTKVNDQGGEKWELI
jgi:hypothetical protein